MPTSGELWVDVFDVGQGDATLVTFPTGKRMLIDMGSTKNKTLTKSDVFTYLRNEGGFGVKAAQTIEYLVLTHGDIDHYNIVKQFVTDFDVRFLNVLHGSPKAEYGDLIGWLTQRMQDRGIALNVVTGERTTPQAVGKGLALTGIAPKTAAAVKGSVDEFGAEVNLLCMGLTASDSPKNAQSVVLQICYPPFPADEADQTRVLLTGDATRATEQTIVANYDKAALRSDILKLGHHGSRRTSNGAQWFAAVDPQFVFVSSDRHGEAGAAKETGHRLPQTIAFDLAWQNSPRLRASNVATHKYVSFTQSEDYVEYNKAPDIKGKTLTVPSGLPATGDWTQHEDGRAFYTTLSTIGAGGNDDADLGVQFRFTLKADGSMSMTVTETDDDVVPSGKKPKKV